MFATLVPHFDEHIHKINKKSILHVEILRLSRRHHELVYKGFQESKANIISLSSFEQNEKVQSAGKKHFWKKNAHSK